MDDREDAALLAAWQGGDSIAGNALVRRHFDDVFHFFQRRVDTAAEDLVQKTFEATLQASQGLTFEVSFRAYLFGVARNQLLMFLRARGRRPEPAQSYSSIASPGGSPSQLASDKERTKVLLRALNELPIELQIPVELFYWHGLRATEIAEATGCTSSTVRGRLLRARELLRGELATMDIGAAVRATTLQELDRLGSGAEDPS